MGSVPRDIYNEAVQDRRTAEARVAALLESHVPRHVHEEVVRQMQRQIDSARLELTHYVALEVHQAHIGALRQQLETQGALNDRLQQQLESLTKDAMSLKKDQQGMAPDDIDYEKLDPMASLPPKTQKAIEEFAEEHIPTRLYLINFAHRNLGRIQHEFPDPDEADAELARIIARGDVE